MVIRITRWSKVIESGETEFLGEYADVLFTSAQALAAAAGNGEYSVFCTSGRTKSQGECQ
jgi:hypothetical protein